MAGESNGSWREVLLEDVADELTVGHVGPMTTEYVESGVPFLRNKNVDPLSIDWDDMRFISREFHEKLKKSALTPGDVVIVRTGKPGAAALIPETLPEANCSDLVIVRCGPKLDRRFLVYYLNSAAKHHIHSHLVGAVQQHFNVGAARKLRMNLPPLSEQQAIAEILGVLDAKIELNRRMNETLESLARSLFKSWFVDFDPVRAKMDGRPPTGLPPATAALFPDSFHESDFGKVPCGWEAGKVRDVASLSRSGLNPGDFPNESFDHFSLPAFDTGRTANVELGSSIKSNKFVVGPDCVLLSKLNPHIPRIWRPTLRTSNRPVCSTEFMVVSPTSRSSRDFLYSQFTDSAFASVYGTLVTGTTGSHQRIRPESFLDIQIVLPPKSIVAAFSAIAGTFFGRASRNTIESQTLAALRDTLLPRLLSGELRVAAASTATKQALVSRGT